MPKPPLLLPPRAQTIVTGVERERAEFVARLVARNIEKLLQDEALCLKNRLVCQH